MVGKEEIINSYINMKMNCVEIATACNVTKQDISKRLLQTEAYSDYQNNEKNESEKKKEKIIDLFYIGNYKIKEIAKRIDCSSAYVTKIIKNDERYQKEKKARKNNNIEKNKEKKLRDRKERKFKPENLISNEDKIREKVEDGFIFAKMKIEQEMAARGKMKSISEDQIVTSNLQHYTYNKVKNRLEYDDTCGKLPMGIPRTKSLNVKLIIVNAKQPY